MLRHERQRRTRLRTSAAMLTILIIATSALFWQHEPTVESPIVHAPSKPKPIVIQTVNDEQLLALLQDTPAALMKMPDGSNTLFIIEP